jgi:hypothetical protein
VNEQNQRCCANHWEWVRSMEPRGRPYARAARRVWYHWGRPPFVAEILSNLLAGARRREAQTSWASALRESQ